MIMAKMSVIQNFKADEKIKKLKGMKKRKMNKAINSKFRGSGQTKHLSPYAKALSKDAN
jgi:hypothetical protein